MTSLLAGTVAHGALGGRGVSTSHHRRTSPGLSGTPRYSPELPGNGSHNSIICKSPQVINWTSISNSRYKKIHISVDLKWRCHISNIATMANSSTLGLLRQNLQTLSLSCKKNRLPLFNPTFFGNQFNNFGPGFAKKTWTK